MPDITDYTGKITSEHSDKPKYTAMVQAVCQSFLGAAGAAKSLPDGFDLDLAIGIQLDAVGCWR